VFDDVEFPLEVVAQQCAEMVKLWTFRAKKKDKEAGNVWTANVSSDYLCLFLFFCIFFLGSPLYILRF
jgi:hypothetical protein